MTSRLLRTASSVSSKLLAGGSTVAGALFVWNYSTVSLDSADADSNKNNSNKTLEQYRIEVDLMDKIAAKPYLLPPSPSSSSSLHKTTNRRPRGVPRRIRVLALDVPEMRHEAFDGECRVHLNRVFADGTAPPKSIALGHDENNINNNRMEVMQKSLAKALVKCRSHSSKRIGVELLEGSVAELNPHNLRRTHQFGNYRFDPGRYATKRRDTKRSGSSSSSNDDSESTTRTGKRTNVNKDTEEGLVLATEEDELDAPWHQYAWIQELQLRIQGRVMFGDPMEPSSRWSRLFRGSVYKSTVPSQRALYEWLLPPWFHRNPAGMDGDTITSQHGGSYCWASQKPHAVIADGAAMQRVPGSLRFLQRTCHDAQVPLYIIHDPRVWGGNTHQDLTEALRDMRKTIKQNIVTQAMRGGSAFARGRMLGQLETAAEWQAKDMGRRTRQAVRDANEKLKRERENDWSKLDANGLQSRLMERGVIVKKSEKKGRATEESTSQEFETTYTAGMIELARRCIAEEEARKVKDTQPIDVATEESETVPTDQAIGGAA